MRVGCDRVVGPPALRASSRPTHPIALSCGWGSASAACCAARNCRPRAYAVPVGKEPWPALPDHRAWRCGQCTRRLPRGAKRPCSAAGSARPPDHPVLRVRKCTCRLLSGAKLPLPQGPGVARTPQQGWVGREPRPHPPTPGTSGPPISTPPPPGSEPSVSILARRVMVSTVRAEGPVHPPRAVNIRPREDAMVLWHYGPRRGHVLSSLAELSVLCACARFIAPSRPRTYQMPISPSPAPARHVHTHHIRPRSSNQS